MATRRMYRRSPIVRRSRRKNLAWVGIEPVNFPTTLAVSQFAYARLVDPNTSVLNRMTQATVMRIVGEFQIWYPFTTPPSATISGRYIFGIKTTDRGLDATNAAQPALDAADDWLLWRGGTLNVTNVGDNYFAARHSIDIRSKRKMDALADQLYLCE